ncbi:hypothetical protein OTB20_12705 [Streptomyces sp. H27-H1]|uniref:hypothetical protein n=1 Tax=Streptomyces sp. H27-H1 TaxID=2996461 RepID=UPI00226DB4F2|nr:hypothetical protein [Streptomyces sp. H27-H1]MCY0927046.1 hypothetical protein [Streptomyces sp. H27-H1]
MGVPSAGLVVDARLNELDYGQFESSPFLEYAVWLDTHGSASAHPALPSPNARASAGCSPERSGLWSGPGPGSSSATACWSRSSSGTATAPREKQCRCSSPRPRTSNRSPFPMTSCPF